MSMYRWILSAALVAVCAVAFAAPAGLDQTGKPDLKSAGALAFGPKGVLFVGDPQGAQIVAIDVGTAPTNPIGQGFKLEGADAKIAAFLGTKADDITINDVVVEPGTNIAYVSVSRGKGPSAEPAIVRVDGKGNVTALSLDKVAYAKVALSNCSGRRRRTRRANRSARRRSPTWPMSMASCSSPACRTKNSPASSARLNFRSKAADTAASVEIFHTNHNAVETRSPVRTFVPFNVGGQPQFSPLTPARRS